MIVSDHAQLTTVRGATPGELLLYWHQNQTLLGIKMTGDGQVYILSRDGAAAFAVRTNFSDDALSYGADWYLALDDRPAAWPTGQWIAGDIARMGDKCLLSVAFDNGVSFVSTDTWTGQQIGFEDNYIRFTRWSIWRSKGEFESGRHKALFIRTPPEPRVG